MFVNEIIPRDEVDKKAKPIIVKYKPFLSSDDIKDGKFSWSIDRNKNIYLIKVKQGREEFCDQSTFVLFKSGDLIEFVLKTMPSTSETEGLTNKKWKLLSQKKLGLIVKLSKMKLIL